MGAPAPEKRVTVTTGLPTNFAEKVFEHRHSFSPPAGVIATFIFRNSNGDEGRLMFPGDGPTRFEGDPEAIIEPFVDMFGERLNEYIDRRVERALKNRD